MWLHMCDVNGWAGRWRGRCWRWYIGWLCRAGQKSVQRRVGWREGLKAPRTHHQHQNTQPDTTSHVCNMPLLLSLLQGAAYPPQSGQSYPKYPQQGYGLYEDSSATASGAHGPSTGGRGQRLGAQLPLPPHCSSSIPLLSPFTSTLKPTRAPTTPACRLRLVQGREGRRTVWRAVPAGRWRLRPAGVWPPGAEVLCGLVGGWVGGVVRVKVKTGGKGMRGGLEGGGWRCQGGGGAQVLLAFACSARCSQRHAAHGQASGQHPAGPAGACPPAGTGAEPAGRCAEPSPPLPLAGRVWRPELRPGVWRVRPAVRTAVRPAVRAGTGQAGQLPGPAVRLRLGPAGGWAATTAPAYPCDPPDTKRRRAVHLVAARQCRMQRRLRRAGRRPPAWAAGRTCGSDSHASGKAPCRRLPTGCPGLQQGASCRGGSKFQGA